MLPSLVRMSFMRLVCPPKVSIPYSFSLRLLSGSSCLRQKDTPNSPATTPTEPGKDSTAGTKKTVSMTQAYKPDDFEKRILVWTKKYKSIEDVPSYVSREEMEKSRSKMRIRISNYMIIATLVGCIIMVYSGKQAAERGDTVAKMNMDWHADLKDQKKREDEAALAKAYNTK
ncbi:UPF0389 protein CG9231 isoform X2 [Phlebotomus papatasi]|uniref:UPF0389 protein CG9231 isoform X2 n=1 Tax=Phlebotomus papatasi TaxID=29031 RepID=UPI0024843EAF|nr:UPF0389 protein CG9231 isoform X2 [Phlebotomus papatasi]